MVEANENTYSETLIKLINALTDILDVTPEGELYEFLEGFSSILIAVDLVERKDIDTVYSLVYGDKSMQLYYSTSSHKDVVVGTVLEILENLYDDDDLFSYLRHFKENSAGGFLYGYRVKEKEPIEEILLRLIENFKTAKQLKS